MCNVHVWCMYWKYETKCPKYLDLFKCEKFQYSSDFIPFFISVVLSFASLKSLKSCLISWLLWIWNCLKKHIKIFMRLILLLLLPLEGQFDKIFWNSAISTKWFVFDQCNCLCNQTEVSVRQFLVCEPKFKKVLFFCSIAFTWGLAV